MVVPLVAPMVDPMVVPMVVPMMLVGVNEDEDDDNQARPSSLSSSSIAALAQAIVARACCFVSRLSRTNSRDHTLAGAPRPASIRINSRARLCQQHETAAPSKTG